MISLDVKSDLKVPSPKILGLEISDKKETLSFSDLLKGTTIKASKDEQILSFVKLPRDVNVKNSKEEQILSFAKLPRDVNVKSSKNELSVSFIKIPKDVNIKSFKDEQNISLVKLPKDINTKSSKKEQSLSLINIPKDDIKIQNITLVVGKDLKTVSSSEEIKVPLKRESLGSILKNDVPILEEDIKVLTLNLNINQNITKVELKTLISDAKQFLKDKILQSEGFKKEENKDLPKTLKGLVQMAKTFGIELSNISFKELKVTPKPIPSIKENIKATEFVVDNNVKILKEIKPSKQVELINANIDYTEKFKTQKSNSVEVYRDIKENIKYEEKQTPLFKFKDKTTLSTEEIVHTKQYKVENKTTNKTKIEETLKLLLRSEKSSLELGNTTKDFSVATAKVIAPSVTTEASKSLESLLKGNMEESVQKLDGISTHKADSFEVKLNEAKQMVKYLSQDVKTAIEDYKSPFTKIKVQLNPQKLGEVELTIVQRGKNLHVNINSNTAAINTLAINANELKAQLSTNGINNATLNFNNNSQNSEQQNAHQQQNRQNERRADEEYNYFEDEELNEEIVSSLEIVVPNYA